MKPLQDLIPNSKNPILLGPRLRVWIDRADRRFRSRFYWQRKEGGTLIVIWRLRLFARSKA